MLWTIAVILFAYWFLGILCSSTLGGFIHFLLPVAMALFLFSMVQGRKIPG
jgi:hypothetical protein